MNTKYLPAISLDNIEITNFKLFGELKATLNSEFTIFIAPNSGGKTAVLDAIALMLSGFILLQQPNIKPTDTRQGMQESSRVKLQLIIRPDPLKPLSLLGCRDSLIFSSSDERNRNRSPPYKVNRNFSHRMWV